MPGHPETPITEEQVVKGPNGPPGSHMRHLAEINWELSPRERAAQTLVVSDNLSADRQVKPQPDIGFVSDWA